MKANLTQRKTGFRKPAEPSLPPPETSNHDLNTQIVSPDDDLMPATPNRTANVQPHPNWVAPTSGPINSDDPGGY